MAPSTVVTKRYFSPDRRSSSLRSASRSSDARAGRRATAVVVEARYSEIFKLTFVRPAVVADAVAECQVRFPEVPIMFCDNRALAQEWTYRFLGAAPAEAREEAQADEVAAGLPAARSVEPAEPTTADVRAWAREVGYAVPDRGRLRAEVWDAYRAAGR